MSLLTLERAIAYDTACSKLMEDKQIQSVCVVNNKGRIVAGQFGKFCDNKTEKWIEVFLMEIALEFSMKREFDSKFGFVEYTFSKRGLVNVMCIPVNDDDVLVVISQRNIVPMEIVKKSISFLKI